MENIIEVKNFTKKYGDHLAVDNISFNVQRGSLFAFLGPNGAGKSTTINTLITSIKKTSGDLLINGCDIDSNKSFVKDKIGVVFQESVLDELLTVKENLETRGLCYNFSKKEIAKRIIELSSILQFKTYINQRYGTLSGGQRRRVDIARAIIHNPEILFLDEPTTGLDPQTRINVWEKINELRIKNSMTIFLTTHYMEETMNADMVAIIDNGKIVAHDTPENLRATYSSDLLKITFKNDDLFKESFIEEYIVKNEIYIIPVKSSLEALKIINNFKNDIDNFEVIHGNMDDVFINITGHEIRGE